VRVKPNDGIDGRGVDQHGTHSLEAPTLDSEIPGGGGNANTRGSDTDLSDAVLMAAHITQMLLADDIPRVDSRIVAGTKKQPSRG
jgi:hypothetical protein